MAAKMLHNGMNEPQQKGQQLKSNKQTTFKSLTNWGFSLPITAHAVAYHHIRNHSVVPTFCLFGARNVAQCFDSGL